MGELTPSVDRLIQYTVIGPGPDAVGTIEGIWVTGEAAEFFGIKTGAVLDTLHLIPAQVATIDDSHRAIEIPYNLNQVKDAPTFGLHAELGSEDKERIYRYWGIDTA